MLPTLLLVAALCLTVSSGAGQTITLQGRVESAAHRQPVRAHVDAINTETRESRSSLADERGTYRILGLLPGTYDIAVRAAGYRPQLHREVRLVVGQRAVLDLLLEEAPQVLAPIEVTAEPSLEIQRTDVSAPVLQEEIESLPLNSRHALHLAALVPGVRSYGPAETRTTRAEGMLLPAAGALSPIRFLNVYVDGVAWKNLLNGNIIGSPQSGSPLPQESIREFRVHVNPYDAELTHGGSHIITAVTHRGSNDFHGSAFGYFQNRALVARGAFQPEKPAYDRQQFGFNLRGPIVRDRLFYSASYEGSETNDFVDVVPGRPTFSPDLWSPFAGSFRAPTSSHAGVLRLTALGGSHTFDAIWSPRSLRAASNFGGTTARDGGNDNKIVANSLLLRDSWLLRPALSSELMIHLLTWQQSLSPVAPGPRRVYPSITFGPGPFSPQSLDERHVRVIGKMTYSTAGPAGSHLIKAGMEIARIDLDVWAAGRRDGVFSFSTDTSSLPFLATISVGSSDPNSTVDAGARTSGWSTGIYVQDEWRPSRVLTLIGGVRYDADINLLNNDFATPWRNDTELQQKLPNGYPSQVKRKNDLDNIAPRLSFSWDVLGTSRTFVRGGYGLMFDRTAGFLALFEQITAGWRTYSLQNPGTTDPVVLRQRVMAGGGTSTPNMDLVKNRMATPETRQVSVGIGQQFGEHLTVNVDHVQQWTRNVYVTTNANYLIPSQRRRAISDRYGDIILWDDFARARFRSLLVGARYQRATLRLNAAYTLTFATADLDATPTLNFPDRRSYSMQRTAGEERHRLVLSGMREIPLRIRLSAIGILASPRPFAVTDGRDLNDNNAFNDDWPEGRRTMMASNSWDHYYRTVDLRLTRDFPIRDTRASVTLEAFNVFDWVNYSSYFGRQMDASGNPLRSFGQPSGDFAPRQIQLGLRSQF